MKTTKLTEEQELDLQSTYAEWLAIGRSCEPLDRESATKAIGDMYEAIGEERPTVMFFSSPIMCVLAYSALRALAKDDSQLSSQLRTQLWSQLDSQLSYYFAGNEWCAWEVFYDFCRRIGVNYTEKENATLNLWRSQSKTCHWWWPYKGIVLASERHTVLNVDSEGRLHCETGPAVQYSDGWGVWALNGVRLSQEIVETPAAQLDAKLILKEENAEIRRELVRKIGIERVCERLGARSIDQQDEYELLMLDLGDGRQRPFLKMRNPSIGVFHIEGVSPECRTVQEALNFRNGLTPQMIDDQDGADFIQQGDVLLFPRGETKFKSQPVQLT